MLSQKISRAVEPQLLPVTFISLRLSEEPSYTTTRAECPCPAIPIAATETKNSGTAGAITFLTIRRRISHTRHGHVGSNRGHWCPYLFALSRLFF